MNRGMDSDEILFIYAISMEYFVIFDLALHSRYDLEYDSLSTFVCVFASMGKFLVVDQVYIDPVIFLLVGWHLWLGSLVSVMEDLVFFGIGKFYYLIYMHDFVYENL